MWGPGIMGRITRKVKRPRPNEKKARPECPAGPYRCLGADIGRRSGHLNLVIYPCLSSFSCPQP